MALALIAIAAALATLIGGLFALRLKDKLHLILGFSAGAVIGVAFFDLLPEAVELGAGVYGTQTVAMLIALGFVAYLVLDRLFLFHIHEFGHEEGDHPHAPRGYVSALTLSIHSFFDGVLIGAAFQVDSGIGMMVALAVLTHDFSDGINTVNMVLKNHGGKRMAARFLVIDALAPVLGIIATVFVTFSSAALAVILALFCGFFIYLGASDLIPESHHSHPKFLTTAMTVAGVAVLFVVIKVAGV